MMLKNLAAFCLLAAALPAWAQTLSQTLPNGLKIIVKEDRRAPVAVAQLWFKVGSVDEEPGKTGLSHALEHMMFKGTPSVPSGEFSRRVQALGGQNNAYTNRSETVYYESVAAKNLPEVLKLEADRMANLNFSDKDFINEMNVIREERRQRTEDDAAGKLWEHVYLNSFAAPALRAPVIGHMADLHKLSADDLRAWYRSRYAPNNAVLVVVGDVDAARTVQTASSLFGNIAAKTLPVRKTGDETAPRTAVRAQTTSAVTHRPLIALSYRVPKLEKLSDTMPYALDVLAEALGGNSSSRLEKNLVRGRQIALSAGVGYDLMSYETPLFSITAMPQTGTTPEALAAAVRAEIAKIAADGISAAELKRIRTGMEASEIYAKDSMEAQASLMGRLEARGFRYSDEAEMRRRLSLVSRRDVQQAAKLLTASRESFVTVLPEAQDAQNRATRP